MTASFQFAVGWKPDGGREVPAEAGKIAGISGKAIGKADNQFGYQGDFSDFEVETDWNEFELRSFDGQTGRFLQNDPYDQFGSPYTGMGNNPINNVDPSGGWLEGMSAISQFVIQHFVPALIGGAIGAANAKSNGGNMNAGFAKGFGIGIAASYVATEVNWSGVGNALGNAGSWVGKNAGGLFQGGGLDGVVALVGGADMKSNGGISGTTRDIENQLNDFYKKNKMKIAVKSFSSDPEASTMDDVYNYLKKNSKKSRPLFVYGYSLGGHTANQAIKRLNADDVDVDLFYAVDAALGLLSKGMEISSNVKQAINVYQTDVSTPPAFSRGYPAKPINGNAKTKITNVNYDAYKSKQGFGAHGAMGGDLQESVTRTFQNQMKFLITGN